MDLTQVSYDEVGPLAWITMDRPEKRNAQSVTMTYELSEAFDRAAASPQIAVVVLAGSDPLFSAGHDITDPHRYEEPDHGAIGTWTGWELPGAEGRLAREHEIYFDMCRRIRDFSKPTIAAVQGRCIGGGLMLAWSCDLIMASENATFLDPVVELGIAGVEWFAHPWELGPRRAKELLMTAQSWDAHLAESVGMVNHVVPNGELRSATQALGERIASKPQFAVKLVKQSVNAMVDAQGYGSALQTAFAYHQLGHSHNMEVHGMPLDPGGVRVSYRPTPGSDD
jgi:enoyl-CoA hydratase